MVQLCELAVNVDLQMPEPIERTRHDLELTRSRDLDLELDRAIVRHPSRGNNANGLSRMPLRAQHQKVDFLSILTRPASPAHSLQAIAADTKSPTVRASLVQSAIIVATWIGK
jgi:hypothetical protein